MKKQAFGFNSRTVKTSKPSEALTNLKNLVTDLDQLDFLDANGQALANATWETPQVAAVKRRPQTRTVDVCDFEDLLADEAKGTYILNQLISDAQFAIVRAAFDTAVNGDLSGYALTVQALYDYVTPVSSGTTSVKIKKSDIKGLAVKFGQYLQTIGVSAKGCAFMFGLAADGFAATTGIEENILMQVAARFTSFKNEAELSDTETDVSEFMDKNLSLAIASSAKVSAADL